MAQLTSVEFKIFKISRREQLILVEIGNDRIDTASSFVDYMQETYGFSKSSTWYCLNQLKGSEVVEFANKQEQGKPLCLTKRGILELGKLHNKNEIVTQFSEKFLNGTAAVNRYSYLRNRTYALGRLG